MKAYLRERLCLGLPPARVNGASSFVRNELVSKMMLARNRIRVLCAPSFFGKTILLYQYAQLVFDFDNVLWMDARHPCFLRDLDDGSIMDSFDELNLDFGLFVFEDVPSFSECQIVRFRRLCYALIEKGFEVLVSCVPGNNFFQDLDVECFHLGAADLLYSKRELEEMLLADSLSESSNLNISGIQRIPGLLRHPKDGICNFLRARAEEEQNAKQRALDFALALMGQGTLEDVASVLGEEVSPEEMRIRDLRPYVCLRDFRSAFAVDGFELDEVLEGISPYLQSTCKKIACGDADTFMSRIATVLLARNHAQRAVRAIVDTCGEATRIKWACEHLDTLLCNCCIAESDMLLRSFSKRVKTAHSKLCFYDALVRSLLFRRSVNPECFQTMLFAPDVETRTRLQAASAWLLFGQSCSSKLSLGSFFEEACTKANRVRHDFDPLLEYWNAALEGDSGLEKLYPPGSSRMPSCEYLVAIALCLHNLKLSEDEPDPLLNSSERQLLPSFLSFATKLVEDCFVDDGLAFVCCLVKDKLDVLSNHIAWSEQSLSKAAKVRAKLQKQQTNYQRGLALRSGAPQLFSAEKPSDATQSCFRQSAHVPLLEVFVFGRFDVRIGGKSIDPSFFTRQKVRSLLVVLLINAGKDVSSKRLASLLWPESVESKAVHNFYAIYSKLHCALKLPDGTCPYLIRGQGVCRLDPLHVKSDLDDLSQLCHALRFNTLDPQSASLLLDKLKTLYPGELLPGEEKIPLVGTARTQWCNRVVEALMFAANKLYESGETGLALDFAHQALIYDPRRENCYELLMQLQAAGAQRAGVIETFQSYQQLNRSLGIAASSRMCKLYSAIINDETDVFFESDYEAVAV